jgi:NADH:ubiquinone oxidoreductase subunit 5 (subunit L)/multisubunit Na+/H+ antiporter MnhA subunit
VIHGTGTQEMPQMGGLFNKMPITAITMLAGVLAIMGFPFFSGFYSKDAIIAQVLAFGEHNAQHTMVLLLPVVAAGITAFYMFRLWFLTFTGKPRDTRIHEHAHESGPMMWVPLAILAVLAVVGAGLPGLPILESFIAYGQPGAVAGGELSGLAARSHELHGPATIVASLTAFTGAALAFCVYYFGLLNPDDARRQFRPVYELLANKWYFDELYRYLFVRPTLILTACCRWIDRAIIDGFLDGSARGTVSFSARDGKFDLGVVDGLANLIGNSFFGGGLSLRRVQTGWLRGYIMLIAVGTVGLFALGAFFL